MPAFIRVWGRLIPWISGCSLIRGLGAAWTAAGHGGRVMLFSCVRGGGADRMRRAPGGRLIPAGAGVTGWFLGLAARRSGLIPAFFAGRSAGAGSSSNSG